MQGSAARCAAAASAAAPTCSLCGLFPVCRGFATSAGASSGPAGAAWPVRGYLGALLVVGGVGGTALALAPQQAEAEAPSAEPKEPDLYDRQAASSVGPAAATVHSRAVQNMLQRQPGSPGCLPCEPRPPYSPTTCRWASIKSWLSGWRRAGPATDIPLPTDKLKCHLPTGGARASSAPLWPAGMALALPPCRAPLPACWRCARDAGPQAAAGTYCRRACWTVVSLRGGLGASAPRCRGEVFLLPLPRSAPA